MNAQLNGLIGLVLPPVIDLINSKVTDSKVRYLVSMGICIVVGVLLNIGDLTAGSLDTVIASVMLVFVSAQSTYNLYWEKSGLRKDMKAKIN